MNAHQSLKHLNQSNPLSPDIHYSFRGSNFKRPFVRRRAFISGAELLSAGQFSNVQRQRGFFFRFPTCTCHREAFRTFKVRSTLAVASKPILLGWSRSVSGGTATAVHQRLSQIMEYPVWGSLGYRESGLLSKRLYVRELRVRVLQISVRSTVFMGGSHKSTCKLVAHFHGCDGDDDNDDDNDDDDCLVMMMMMMMMVVMLVVGMVLVVTTDCSGGRGDCVFCYDGSGGSCLLLLVVVVVAVVVAVVVGRWRWCGSGGGGGGGGAAAAAAAAGGAGASNKDMTSTSLFASS